MMMMMMMMMMMLVVVVMMMMMMMEDVMIYIYIFILASHANTMKHLLYILHSPCCICKESLLGTRSGCWAPCPRNSEMALAWVESQLSPG